jgi:hypothetical protein
VKKIIKSGKFFISKKTDRKIDKVRTRLILWARKCDFQWQVVCLSVNCIVESPFTITRKVTVNNQELYLRCSCNQLWTPTVFNIAAHRCLLLEELVIYSWIESSVTTRSWPAASKMHGVLHMFCIHTSGDRFLHNDSSAALLLKDTNWQWHKLIRGFVAGLGFPLSWQSVLRLTSSMHASGILVMLWTIKQVVTSVSHKADQRTSSDELDDSTNEQLSETSRSLAHWASRYLIKPAW